MNFPHSERVERVTRLCTRAVRTSVRRGLVRVQVGRDENGQLVRDSVGLVTLNGDVNGFPEHRTQSEN